MQIQLKVSDTGTNLKQRQGKIQSLWLASNVEHQTISSYPKESQFLVEEIVRFSVKMTGNSESDWLENRLPKER